MYTFDDIEINKIVLALEAELRRTPNTDKWKAYRAELKALIERINNKRVDKK